MMGERFSPGAVTTQTDVQGPELDGDNVRGTVTKLLADWQQGDDTALAAAVTAVYEDLRRIASRQLLSERQTPTLDAETLVHEAYLRLARQDRTSWKNRGHFLAVAARIMRRLLVDRARGRRYVKRGGDAVTTTLDGKSVQADGRPLDVLVLDDALSDLAKVDRGLCELVEMRFFAGLTNAEIGDSLGVAPLTVIRRWRLARAWLQRYLTKAENHDGE